MNTKLILTVLNIAILTGCSTDYMDKKQSRDRFMDNSIIVRNAKKSYQIGHNLPDGTEATWDDIRSCLPAHWRPICLEGGYITPGKLGEPMKCSVHGQMANPRHGLRGKSWKHQMLDGQ